MSARYTVRAWRRSGAVVAAKDVALDLAMRLLADLTRGATDGTAEDPAERVTLYDVEYAAPVFCARRGADGVWFVVSPPDFW